jgi:hypothetical protein
VEHLIIPLHVWLDIATIATMHNVWVIQRNSERQVCHDIISRSVKVLGLQKAEERIEVKNMDYITDKPLEVVLSDQLHYCNRLAKICFAGMRERKPYSPQEDALVYKLG